MGTCYGWNGVGFKLFTIELGIDIILDDGNFKIGTLHKSNLESFANSHYN